MTVAPCESYPATEQPLSDKARARRTCPSCGKFFSTKNGKWDHFRMFHAAPREESFAERAVQAEIDRACGFPSNDDWLLS